MRIAFLGTADFAVPCLQKLHQRGHEIVGVVTQPDRPRGRGKQLAPPPVKIAAVELGLEIFQPERIKEEDSIDKISSWKPDCLVVVAYGQLLPKELLAIPPMGCVNVHASLLPKYRGGAPIHRAIIDGQKETGVTIMLVNEELDAGDIILQKGREITSNMTVGELHDKLSADGAELLLEALQLMGEGKANMLPQKEAEATYAPLLTREDEKIQWKEKAAHIVNLIRGMDPWPGAYTTLEGKNLKIWRGKISPLVEGSQPKPGTLVEISSEGYVVVAGDGQGVLITQLQLQGKRRMSAEDFHRGNPLEVGTILGSD